MRSASAALTRTRLRALTQGLRKLPALVEVGRHDELLMPVQRLANGLAMHVGIAVHVAADPGAEPQNAWHFIDSTATP